MNALDTILRLRLPLLFVLVFSLVHWAMTGVQQMYMAAVQQNPAMMFMPYMAQYPMYSRMALPTDVSNTETYFRFSSVQSAYNNKFQLGMNM